MTRTLTILLLLVMLSFCANQTEAAEAHKPLKIIAPDLVVESIQFGKFLTDNAPDEAGFANFVPTSIIKNADWIGFRIKVKTSRPKILLWDISETLSRKYPWRKGRGEYVKPVNGYIYRFWIITGGYPAGKHWNKVWLDNVELPQLNYEIRH